VAFLFLNLPTFTLSPALISGAWYDLASMNSFARIEVFMTNARRGPFVCVALNRVGIYYGPFD